MSESTRASLPPTRWPVVLRLLARLRRAWWLVLLAYLCLAGTVAFTVVVPALTLLVIDQGIGLNREGQPTGSIGELALYASLIVVAAAVRGLFAYGQSFLAEYLSQRVAYDLRNDLYERIQRLSFSFHDRSQTGQLMSRATTDVDVARMFLSMGLLRATYTVVLFAVVLVLMLRLNVALALVMLVSMPLVAARAVTVSRRVRPISLTVQQKMGEYTSVLQENLIGVRAVKAFAREDEEHAKFQAANWAVREKNLEANRITAFNQPLMLFLLNVSTAALLLIGGWAVIDGAITLGMLVAFLQYRVQLAAPVRLLGFISNLIARASSAGDRIFEILDAESEVADRPGARDLRDVRGHVRFEAVGFGYGGDGPHPAFGAPSPNAGGGLGHSGKSSVPTGTSPGARGLGRLSGSDDSAGPSPHAEGRRSRPHSSERPVRPSPRIGGGVGVGALRPIVQDIDIDAKPGETVAVLGATGSGKSTILNLLPRFYDVTAGRITIDGVDIRDVTVASLRANVGVVLQDIFLFSATVRENIAYGRPDATMQEIEAAAKAARIHDFVMTLPDGYDTWVGERGVTLSGGQKQRVAIARTLLLDPRVLVLDDSTSSVDMETEYLIQQALREVMQGRTTFVIAHRLRTIRDADQILILDRGRIVQRGRHADLVEQPGLYREIYELQFREQEEAHGPVASSQ